MSIHLRDANLADVPGIARVHVESWRTTYQGIVPAEYLAALSVERREQMWRQIIEKAEPHTVLLVAENADGSIIGFVNGGQAREDQQSYQAELYAIYLLETYQRRGLGRQLVQALAEKLLAAGLTSMFLWVLIDNPTCRFYERLGGLRGRVQTIEIGGKSLDEVVYGWPDLQVLL